MTKLLHFFLILFSINLCSQTFSGTGGGISDDGQNNDFTINVNGLAPSALNNTHGLVSVCFNITHTYDSDLNINLIAPDGTNMMLVSGAGGSGNNFTNTCFNQTVTNSIFSGSAPFTGTFKPMNTLGNANNNQNGNGAWKLRIVDTYAQDVGNLLNWSITFGSNAPLPNVFTASDLPIVMINTFSQTIVNEPKIDAGMKIIYNGPGVTNYTTDLPNAYNNNIGIEIRGSSSSGFPQKSYGLETRDVNNLDNDTILLGMPAEHDWILYAPYDDKTCIRNVLSYDIANKTGHYASRTQFCELLINGQYQGIYVLMEKVKRDNNRVDVSKLLPTDISGDQLTGGYIIKVDRDDGPNTYWTSSYNADDGTPVNFVYVYPNATDIAPQQKAYIQAYIDTVEDVLASPTFSNPVTGYRKYIGVTTFIDYFLLNELSKNVDGYRLSTFFHKDKYSQGGKLHAGPAWDYNIAWWNADYCQAELYTGWAWNQGTVCPGGWQNNFWWRRLLEDPGYTAELKCRWNELRLTTLSIPVLNNYIDSVAGHLNQAQARHFDLWPILGVYTWPNPSPIATSYAGEITALKNWILNRITWMDSNLPGVCTVGLSENELSDKNVTLSPNPFSHNFNVKLYLAYQQTVDFQVTDVLGNVVKQLRAKDLNDGESNIEINFDQSLNNGVYFLKITSGKKNIVKKIIKTN
ncbi:MAG: CotH kinase family protein [Bacteroidota bacterium]